MGFTITVEVTMKALLLIAAMLVAAGYYKLIPALSGISDLPGPLMAGGLATFCMIYLLAKVEP